ncbi:unnamed protein product [Victoria cruziana]
MERGSNFENRSHERKRALPLPLHFNPRASISSFFLQFPHVSTIFQMTSACREVANSRSCRPNPIEQGNILHSCLSEERVLESM